MRNTLGLNAPRLLTAAALVASALSLGCSGAADDDRDTNPRTDCTGKCDAIDGGMSALPAAVSSVTWDGNVVFGTRDDSCQVMAVRAQRFDVTAHAVDVPPAAFSAGVPCPAELGAHALVADPSLPANPFVSDAAGNPAVDGTHLTYRAHVYAAGDGERLAAQTVQVVVAQPDTDDAEVTSVAFTDDAVGLVANDGSPIPGTSPTLTADGGLMIFERDGSLHYSRKVDRTTPAASGWTTPQPLTRLVAERDVLLDGVAVGARYPIAAQTLRVPDGRMFPQGLPLYGAHPWVSRDGTELFFTAVRGGPDQERVAALSAVGRDTGWVIRHIDGAVNPSREALDGPAMLRRQHVSPGQLGGFWTPYRDAAPALAQRDRPVYPLFGTIGDADNVMGTYNEVDFSAYVDGDYTLYLPMNEMLVPVNVTELGYATDRTADISGNLANGVLENGARFAVEEFGLDDEGLPAYDENTGANGRAVYLPEAGRVRVPATSWSLVQPETAFTVQAYVQRLQDVSSDEADRGHAIVRWPGVAEIAIGEDGILRSTVVVDGQAQSSGPAGAPLPINGWVHAALTYDMASGTLRTYRDGELVDEQTLTPGPVGPATGDIVVGPGGEAGAPLLGDTAIVAVDEVALSRVARTETEILRSAGRAPEPTTPQYANESLLDLIDLPSGLDPDELEVSADYPMSAEAVELGRMLFFDPRLSANGEISCATCHDPEFGWSDGLATGFGIDDQALTRNSPTIINRAFSTEQFWGGRAESLEIQAIGPIISPVEMGSNIPDLIAFLESVPGYVDAFESAYGEGPRVELVAGAIASFERTVLSGDSPVDRYLAGDTDALSESAVRGMELFEGRARCSQCHSGSNFTDESFHHTGLVAVTDDDTGRYATSRRTEDLHAYKTPTLRNIADTGPYFHDGSVATLEEVVALYVAGPGVQGADRHIRPLDLSTADQADLVAFLEALSDPAALQVQLPELPPLPADPE